MVKMDSSKATVEWLNSRKQNVKWQYQNRWEIWIEYCKAKGLLSSGSEQLEDIKKRRMNSDNTVKFFYDNEVPKFFQWLQTEYKGKTTNKPLAESSALAVTTAIRSFFAYHRYRLEIRKDALPSSEKVARAYKDHAFDIYQLREMFQRGNLQERTILVCGKDLWLRSGDFTKLNRDLIELAIKRETEKAENEQREHDIVEFELTTEKEKEPCSCHLSRETIELLNDYLKTYPKTERLFPLTEDALNDLLRRLARKSKITKTGKIRWHCLRKFGITLMHGKITEPVMKYMTGKHISADLKTYIQNNRETFKAFKLLEPLISLTKQNGNGANKKLAEQIEELKKATFKQLILQKFVEKTVSKERKAEILKEIAEELGLTEDVHKIVIETSEPTTMPDFDTVITVLADAYRKKDLERIFKENGNNH